MYHAQAGRVGRHADALKYLVRQLGVLLRAARVRGVDLYGLVNERGLFELRLRMNHGVKDEVSRLLLQLQKGSPGDVHTVIEHRAERAEYAQILVQAPRAADGVHQVVVAEKGERGRFYWDYYVIRGCQRRRQEQAEVRRGVDDGEVVAARHGLQRAPQLRDGERALALELR